MRTIPLVAIMISEVTCAGRNEGHVNRAEDDRRIFEGILSLMYIARRRDPGRGGMGVIQMERLQGCPAEHLEFHIWYLHEKGWIERQNDGLLAITAAGVDRMVEQDVLILRRDRMIAETHSSGTAPGSETRALKEFS